MTEQITNQSEHPEIAEVNWIDNCFRVYKTQYGLWHSVTKEGKELVTSLTEEQCISGARFYLKGLQDGWDQNVTRYEGEVGGKL
jgi:hypothetical protein